jgi:hypothetical protein
MKDNVEYMLLIFMPTIFISIFFAIAVIYNDFAVGLVSSGTLVVWGIIVIRYIVTKFMLY